MYTLT